MKKQIEEIQNYFVNKITACDFDNLEFIPFQHNSIEIKLQVDGYCFQFIFNTEYKTIYQSIFDNFMKIEIPNNRLLNIIDLINERESQIKDEKIEKLKSELDKLENQTYNV